MEHIITKNKLDKIVFKYLDMKLNGIKKRKGVYVDIVFAFPDEEYGLLGWKKSGDLYVSYELRDEIKNMFGLESPEAFEVIGKYVEDRHNLEVKNTTCMAFFYFN